MRHAIRNIFAGLMILVPVSIGIIRKVIQKPLNKIVEAMKIVEDGSFDVKIEEYSSITDFKTLIESFNHMVTCIQKLKIENYEIQLSEQKVTMQYLMKQIRPHFYANILNIIYSLAEAKKFEKIQEIAVDVSHYSRYMFRDAMELVELERELEHVRDYIKIQKIRYGEGIWFEENVDDCVKAVLIPPFVIQGFIENSMKYAFSTKAVMKVCVKAWINIEKQKVIIEIKDNGSGYPDEVLNHWKNTQKEGHIGLYNIYRRVKLIYENDADIELYNEDGAVSRLIFPYIALNMMQEDDEI